jgi:hypothetical protein
MFNRSEKSILMPDREKAPVAGESRSPPRENAIVDSNAPADRRRFLDALEDDEVRENLKKPHGQKSD